MPSHSILQRLEHNARALLLLLADLTPRSVVRTDIYVRLRRHLSRTPQRFMEPSGPALPFTRGEWRERKLASASTDLVIDAFPGSGSSFVSNSLRQAISVRCNVESHFHYVAQLERAIAYGVPALVIVRHPLDAGTSLKSKEPALASWLILLRWITYHRYVRRHFRELHVFLFDELTADLDLVRRRCPAVSRLVDGIVCPNTGFKRASLDYHPLAIDGALNGFLLRRAERIYQDLERAVVTDMELGVASPQP